MKEWTEFLMPHLMLAPIMLPMFMAALMLFMGEERQRLSPPTKRNQRLSIGGAAGQTIAAVAAPAPGAGFPCDQRDHEDRRRDDSRRPHLFKELGVVVVRLLSERGRAGGRNARQGD